MSRFLTALLTLAGLFAVLISPARAAQPNIVLLMGDDHGWDETGYNGHPYLKTPVLDQMARTGLRLDRFYSGGSTCSPTRGTVMTGRHHNRYGTLTPNCSTRPEEITIAQMLQRAGYATAHFGKWHLGAVKAESPLNPGKLGFDTWLSHDNFFELHPTFSRNGAAPVQIKGESSEIVIAEAIKFIDEAKRAGKPFFVVVWFGSPHEPYQALPKDLALYNNLPENFGTREVQLTSNETGGVVKRKQRDVLRERFAEITAMDRSIGQLRDHLSNTGLKQDTLLWYCGDNGTPQEAVATVPFRRWKGSIYEGGIRVAGLIEWPARIRQPRATDVNAVTSDILPTLAELTSQPLPNRPLDGISLTALLDGRMTSRPRPIAFWNGEQLLDPKARPYIEPALQEGTTPLVKLMNGKATRNFENYRHPEIREQDFGGSRSIVDNRFKLVLDGEGATSKSRELFDLRADPAEKNNIIAHHPAEAEKLERQLREWQGSVLKSLTGADYR